MIESGTHTIFIAWAYAGVGILTLLTLAYVLWDAAAVRRRLAALDKAGIRRRSAGPEA